MDLSQEIRQLTVLTAEAALTIGTEEDSQKEFTARLQNVCATAASLDTIKAQANSISFTQHALFLLQPFTIMNTLGGDSGYG